MDPTIIFMIMGVVAGLLLGVLVGFLVGNRSKHKRELAEETEIAKTMESQIDERLSSLEPPAALTNRVKEGYQPLVCLWRGRESGLLAAEIKGKLFPSSEILEGNTRDQMKSLANEWETWLGGEANIRAGKAPERVVAPPLEATADRAFATRGTEPVIAEIETQVISPAQKSLGADAVVEEDDLKSKSMVEQIDEILQKKLASSPMANRAIRLVESPSKGVIVWVGLEHYDGIDEVKDPAVIAVIRSAAADWEKLSGGKRRAP